MLPGRDRCAYDAAANGLNSHTSISASGGVALAREFTIGKVPVGLSANINATGIRRREPSGRLERLGDVRALARAGAAAPAAANGHEIARRKIPRQESRGIFFTFNRPR